ncbi:hypothetical protein [Pseudomonas sp. 21LCFQ010]|nr:hypothetical protein [Pseudomonas sp. 21LCFQ010]
MELKPLLERIRLWLFKACEIRAGQYRGEPPKAPRQPSLSG